jgi:hypothetical protein
MASTGKTKTVTFEVSIWWNPEDRKIRLARIGPEAFIATINNDAQSMRGHPKLFRELAKILKKAGAPAP